MASIGKIIDGECEEFANDDDILVISKEIIENTPITFQHATQLANVQSDDSISVALAKLSKLYETLENGIGAANAARAVVTDGTGNLTTVENVSGNDISMLEGITGNIQSQLDNLGLSSMRQRYRSSSDQTIDCLDRNLQTGVYWINTSNYTDTNLPEGETVGSLVVLSAQVRLFIQYKSIGFYVNDYVNNTWQGWKKYEESRKVFGVENFASSGASYSDANLKILLHNRMKALIKNQLDSTKNATVPWYGVWEGVGYLRGEITTIPNNLYMTTCYSQDKYFIAFGSITESDARICKRIDLPEYTANAPRIKTWDLRSQWVPAGGNAPAGITYGSVLRLKGQDEPGVGSVNDTVFLLVAFKNNAVSGVYTAYQAVRGSKFVPWTKIGGVVELEPLDYMDTSSSQYDFAKYVTIGMIDYIGENNIDKHTIYTRPIYWADHNYYTATFRMVGTDDAYKYLNEITVLGGIIQVLMNVDKSIVGITRILGENL